MKLFSNYSNYDDQKLISLIAQSQEEALAQLYDRYHRLVFSLAYAIVRDQATAEEITLDVFMRVWQKAETYQPDQSKVSTWLTHITRHHSIDILRRRAARQERQAVIWDEEFRPDPGIRNLSDSSEDSMQRKRIQNALARLPVEQKQTLFLAYFEGYTQRQIAELLKEPLGTIKTRMRLAMQKLRDFLQDEGDENKPEDTSADVPSAYNLLKKE